MAHPFASQAQASQKRRLSALGGKIGKPYGATAMYKKHAYPRIRAGSDTEMTISGGSSKKRADRKSNKYADGGRIVGGGRVVRDATRDTSPGVIGSRPPVGGVRPRFRPAGGGVNRDNQGPGRGRGQRSKNVTNVIIADRGKDRDRPVPVPVNRPVPVPVRGAAPVARRPVVAAPAAAPPVAAPAGPPVLPPAMPPAVPPRGVAPGMGLADGGLAGSSYHNWGEGYKAGGAVKKAQGGFLKDESPDGYKGYPHSPTTEVDDAVSAKKDGGAIRKAQFGGMGRNMLQRGGGQRPGGFQAAPPPGTAPTRGGPPVVPLTGGGTQRRPGGLGYKKGGKAEKYKHGGHADEAQDRKLFTKMFKARAEKKADGGTVKTPITNATGGGAGGLARLKKTSAAKSVPAKTEDTSSASAAGHNPAPRGLAGGIYHQQGKGMS